MEKILSYLISKQIGFKLLPSKHVSELHLIDNYDSEDLAALLELVALAYKRENKIIIVIV